MEKIGAKVKGGGWGIWEQPRQQQWGEGAAVIGAIDGIKTFGCNRGGVIGLRTLDSAVDLNHNSISKML